MIALVVQSILITLIALFTALISLLALIALTVLITLISCLIHDCYMLLCGCYVVVI